MNLSLRAKVLAVSAAGLAFTIAVGVIAYVQLRRITDNQATMAVAQSSLRRQLEADMMHDALRADVLGALHAGVRSDRAAHADALKNLGEHTQMLRERIHYNQTNAVGAAARAAFQEIQKPLEDYIRQAESIVPLALESVDEAERKAPEFMKSFKVLEARMEDVSGIIEQSATDLVTANLQLVRRFSIVVGAAVAVSGVALFALSLLVAKSIPRPFQKLASDLSELARGTSVASIQVAAASQSLADGANVQAASLEETSAALEQMASMTRRNADSALSAKELAAQTRAAADGGAEDMRALSNAMDAIRSSSDNIAKIIKTIDEIAFQTNILALNAAVEAARAGDAGAGFAVVADEVRNLAQRCAHAAHETTHKIEDSIRRSEEGVQLTGKVATGLKGIVARAHQLDDLVASIATATGEQSQGIAQVNTAVADLDKVTQRNAADAEEGAHASEQLREQSRTLDEAVMRLSDLVVGKHEHQASAAAAGSIPMTIPMPAPTPTRLPLRNGSLNGRSALAAVPRA